MEVQENEKKYRELAEKWMTGNITSQEQAEFSAWYDAEQDEHIILPGSFAENKDILRERILQYIQHKINEKTEETIKSRFTFMRVAAAVVIFMVLTGAGAWYFFRQHKEVELTKKNSNTPLNLAPGGNKAELTLADGSKIILGDLQNGALAQQGNTKLVIMNAGQLAYNQQKSIASDELLYNTISTPKGGQFLVVLADGTKVWLNAASSLRFPIAFKGAKRNVELMGEAYFEVAQLVAENGKKMAFTVNVKPGTGDEDLKVEVLGTHFNMMAYHDEQAIVTTLLEGAVKITKGEHTSLLKPGKQACFNKAAGNMQVSDADMEEAVAWKNGLFQFYNEDIQLIMRQLSRWYDAEIFFDEKMEKRDFTGQFQRSSGIEQVLKKLEATSGVHFKTNGKKITVMQ